MLQLCALCHILSVYIGIRNVIQTDFGFYFATLGSFGAYLTWHLMVMLTLNSCHDLARVWRNKDVIPMVMLPFPLSYYHCHYNIEFFSPNWIRHSWLHLIRALMFDALKFRAISKKSRELYVVWFIQDFETTKLPFIMGDPLLLLPYHCR